MTHSWGTAVIAPVMAAAAGLALLASHPPIGWWWLVFLPAPLLLGALWFEAGAAGARGRLWGSWRLGALFGLVAFGPMLSWLIAPAGYVGWGLLVGVQAIWFGLLAIIVRPFMASRWLPVVAAVAWTGVDALRAMVPLSGFEWGALAYAHAEASWMLPIARLVGARGITFLTVLIGVSAAVAVRTTARNLRKRDHDALQSDLGPASLPVALLVGSLLVSVLATIEPPPTKGTLDVLVVQGNDIRHWEDPVTDAPLTITTNLRDETLEAIGSGPSPDLTVWPESGIDRDPTSRRGATLAPLVEDAATAAGDLLSGATMDGPDPATQRYVAALRFGPNGQEQERYVKRRLVPFGEYIPARGLLDWFPPLEQVGRDAQAGPEAQQMSTSQGVRLAVIICFETLFPDVLRGNVLAGEEPAQLILAITNDASFQDSAEPAQHLAQSQLRAVETGRWVVHGSLSGSSAFIDPDGRLLQTTPVFERTSIRRDVPLVEGLTPFLVTGDVVGWAARLATLVLLVVAGLWARREPGQAATAGSGPEA